MIQGHSKYHQFVSKLGAQETESCTTWANQRSVSNSSWIAKVDSIEFAGVKINKVMTVSSFQKCFLLIKTSISNWINILNMFSLHSTLAIIITH